MTDDKTYQDPRRDAYAAFVAKLDAFGADSRRWPEADRKTAACLPEADSQARLLLAEARALDALLGHSTAVREPQRLASLEDLIVSAAVAERAARHSSAGNVVPMRVRPADTANRTPAPTEAAERASAQWRVHPGWRSAAMLAASLFAGVIIGITEPAQTTVRTVLAAVEPQSTQESGDLAAAIQADTIELEDTL